MEPAFNPGSDPLNLSFSYGTSTDNGNLLSQTIARGSQSWTQSYPAASYDGANRLTGAAETGGSNEWSQSYGYDQWGNRAASGTIVNQNATPTATSQYTNKRAALLYRRRTTGPGSAASRGRNWRSV